jgi:putative ATP-dependent endonuclease of OLD family
MSPGLKPCRRPSSCARTGRPVTTEPTRFGTFVGVVPTVDAKVAATYKVAKAVHTDVLCLVDGDSEGLGYLDGVKALKPPPRIVFVWPDDWCTEDVIGWIAKASPAEALSAVNPALGTTFIDCDALAAHLETKKSYAPVHLSVAEALARIPACRTRAAELLNDIADVARDADGQRTHLALWPEKSTPTTKVWRLTA